MGAWAWGYSDDHSLIKSSYCTGAVGRMANDEANEMRYGTGLAGSAALAQARMMLKAQSKQNKPNNTSNSSNGFLNRSKHYGEADQKAQLDKNKVNAALQKLEREKIESLEKRGKRKYNSMNNETEVTEEDMEAYRLQKEISSDPMAKISSDEILEYK